MEAKRRLCRLPASAVCVSPCPVTPETRPMVSSISTYRSTCRRGDAVVATEIHRAKQPASVVSAREKEKGRQFVNATDQNSNNRPPLPGTLPFYVTTWYTLRQLLDFQ